MEQGGDQGPAEETPAGNRSRVEQLLGGRPLMVYVVLAAGILVLGILLAIVWFSATGGGRKEQPLCPGVSAQEAAAAVQAGKVAKVAVLVDTTHRNFPVLLRFTTTDDKCFNGPQGPAAAQENYQLLGLIDFYNQANTDGGPDIRRSWTFEEVPADVLNTPTPTPTVVPTPTATPIPTATATPTPLPPSPTVPPPPPTVTPSPIPTPTPRPSPPPASPRAASPAATPSPAASPRVTGERG